MNLNKKSDFEAIVYKYHLQIFRTAMGFLHIKEDAEDITQEVFIKAYKSWEKFKGDSEISTWLYRITVNECLSYIDKKKRRNIFNVIVLKDLFNQKSEEKNSQEKMEENDRNKIIRNALDSLPEKQKIAFVLSKYDDLSQNKIAEIMKTTEGAVEQLLQRAKNNLRKKIKL